MNYPSSSILIVEDALELSELFKDTTNSFDLYAAPWFGICFTKSVSRLLDIHIKSLHSPAKVTVARYQRPLSLHDNNLQRAIIDFQIDYAARKTEHTRFIIIENADQTKRPAWFIDSYLPALSSTNDPFLVVRHAYDYTSRRWLRLKFKK